MAEVRRAVVAQAEAGKDFPLFEKEGLGEISVLIYNKRLKSFSQKLRAEMTKAEKILWSKIRRKQVSNAQFYRQKPIGKYIADFYCPKLKIVIEIDGGHHYEDKNIVRDKLRNANFKQLGLTVLRFTNIDVVKNIDGVTQKISNQIK